MKKLYIFLVLLLGLNLVSFGQHRYIYSQYMLNPVLLNPGATGFNGGHNLFLNYKNTWANHPGTPKTFSFSYDGSVANKVGLGALVMSDNFSALQTLKGQLSYSYNIKGENYNFGLGFTTEYIDYHVSGALGDGIVDRNDPYLQQRQDGDKFFELAVGAYGLVQDKFILSVAFPALVRTVLSEREINEEKAFNYILGIGYMFKMPEYKMCITPNIYVKKLWQYNTMIDANLLFSFYDNRFSTGVMYGIGEEKTLGFLIGTRLNKFNFYYSYDFAFKDFQAYNNGSHELTVGLNFGAKQ
ncbi:MAG: PorP/SprF family type IX secretion system membrane protein [Deltaproteobacteria bacterium]